MTEAELRRRFGRSVAAARRARGWSQEELAEAGGVSRNEVSLVERGEVTCSLWVASRLANVLGATIDGCLQRDASERELRVAELVRRLPAQDLDRAAALLELAFDRSPTKSKKPSYTATKRRR